MPLNKLYKSIIFYPLIVVCGFISTFFVFYTIRLFYITQGLLNIKVGGKGTYIGAIVFPILALTFGFIAWRLYKNHSKNK